MIMADVFSILLLVLSVFLGTVSLWVLCGALWPNMSQLSAKTCNEGTFKCLLMGIPYSIFGFGSFIALAQVPNPGVKIICGVIFVAYLAYASIGVSGLATVVGNRLRGVSSATDSPWRSTIFGSLILAFTCLIPFLGWFFFLSLLFVVGSGARAKAGFLRKKSHVASEAPSETPTAPLQENVVAPPINAQIKEASI